MNATKSILLAVAAGIGLTACAPTGGGYGQYGGGQQYGGQNQPSNAQTGAIAGAMLGGVLGATSGGDERLTKAAAGAIVGGLVGGAAGGLLDRQARELQSEIGGNGTTITNTGSNLVVSMPQDILFATNSATVSASVNNDLYALADNLNRYPNTRVQVIGHTDNTGSAAFNQDLSQRRAAAVAQVIRNGGVNPARVVYFGRGEEQPVASNLTPEGRAQNRRVDIIITPTN